MIKIVYAGAPEFSVAPLQALLDAGHKIVAVITQPDKPVGRKGILTPTPLKKFAKEKGIPVFSFNKIRLHVADVRALGGELMVTCAYGQILTEEILQSFPMGVFNIHASLLPRWRGASPIQHAILAGDAKTGITVMKTDVGLDTGDMLLCIPSEIEPLDTAKTLAEKLSALGGKAIVEALEKLKEGRAVFTRQQDSEATLCKKIEKKSCEIDFMKSAKEIGRLVRAMNPEPLAYTYLKGKLVNFWLAEALAETEGGSCGQVVRADKTGIYVKTGQGVLRILMLQLEGGKCLKAADVVNGRKVAVGDVFGSAQ